MKRNIRKGVFETNSSSTHSIVISPETPHMYDTIHPDGNGEIWLNGGEFGWNWERFDDAKTKANYCAVDQFGNEVNMQMLMDVLKEHTGAKEIMFNFTTNWDVDELNHSYVDHQSYGTSSKAFESKRKLKNFIFNPYSILFTGNDNSDAPMNFFIEDGDIPRIPYIMHVNGFDFDEPMYIRDKEDTDEIHEQLESFVQETFECYWLDYNAVDYQNQKFSVESWDGKKNKPKVLTYRFEANPKYDGKTNVDDMPVQVDFDQFLRSINVDDQQIVKIMNEMKRRNLE